MKIKFDSAFWVLQAIPRAQGFFEQTHPGGNPSTEQPTPRR
jgi:hypothetical protein